VYSALPPGPCLLSLVLLSIVECLWFLFHVHYSLFLSKWRHQKRHQELFLRITLWITFYVPCFQWNPAKLRHLKKYSKNYSRYVGLRISSGNATKIVSSHTFLSFSISALLSFPFSPLPWTSIQAWWRLLRLKILEICPRIILHGELSGVKKICFFFKKNNLVFWWLKHRIILKSRTWKLQTQIGIRIIIQIPILRRHVPCNKVRRLITADTLVLPCFFSRLRVVPLLARS